MFFSKKKEATKKYDSQNQKPVIRCSICNGEQVAGFKDLRTGSFHEVSLIRSDKDLKDFMKTYGIRCGAVYLSLGDKEEKARNPVMAAVGDRIREAHEILTAQGVRCALEWNPGNHFRDAAQRTAKAFAWLMNEKQE